MTYDDPTTRPHTLKSIAYEANREKRTVQRWYEKACAAHDTEELGEVIDGTRYFSDAERQMLLTYLGERTAETTESQPVTPTITVETGNHQMVLATPQLPTAFSLESLRSTEVVAIADPLAVAAEFLQLADQLTDAMQADIQARQHRVQQAKAAKDVIAQKTQALQLEARLYQLQTAHLDTALNQETEEFTAKLSTLQAMGKPADG